MAASKQVTVQFYSELDITKLQNANIYHIHGVIEPKNPEELIGSVILSKRDYEIAYRPNTGLPRFLADLSTYSTILFIGYSLGDDELVKVIHTTQLELVQRGTFEFQAGLGKRIQLKHYILMHQNAKVNNDAISELGLLPICYGGDQNRQSELERLLSYIRIRTTGVSYPEPAVNREC